MLNSRPLSPPHDYMPHAKAFGNNTTLTTICVHAYKLKVKSVQSSVQVWRDKILTDTLHLQI